MSRNFEELSFCATPLGDLLLRRRRMIEAGGEDIYEVKLGEHFLMSSLFFQAERQLAKLALAKLPGEALDVVIGGLGLGYTALAALEDARVRTLAVVEYLKPVIDWHQQGLVPLGSQLTADARCDLVHGDFFALARSASQRKVDAVLLDIDHTPQNTLQHSNQRFYTQQGYGELARHLKPGGVFALWADGRPDPAVTTELQKVFCAAEDHDVAFDNPLTGEDAHGAIYVAQLAHG
ncbi:MAG: spermidine synthase [Deltaproteobacteria bacterium]|nr:spermidine synthase [Deltaproteobacteria bacterium]